MAIMTRNTKLFPPVSQAGILPNIASPPIQPSLPISSLVHTDADLAVPNDPIMQAENNVQGALDDLQSIGALQRSNWMTINELLNPAAESHKISYATDGDIYKAVIDAMKAQENGSGDNVDNDARDSDNELAITRREALQAVLTLRKFTKTFNDPFFRKAEVILGSFG